MIAEAVAVVLAVVIVLGLMTVWLSSTAGRLDRLHIRLATAQASLERQLVDRAAAAADVAHSGALDPAGSVLLLAAADAARQAARVNTGAGDGGHADRDAAESALSAALRAVLGDPDSVAAAWRHEAARPLLVELAASCDRLRLAVTFHDDLATRTRAMRRRRLVRWAHLAGHAGWPVVVDLDDEPPAALLQAAELSPAGH